MKKLILSIAAVAVFTFTSCSSDDDGGKSFEELAYLDETSFDLKTFIKTNYNGQIFNFEDESEFIAFYVKISSLEPDEFNDFLKFKAGNNSSHYYSNLITEEDINFEEGINFQEVKSPIFKVGELIIPDFLSTIFNKNNEIIIGDKIIYLDEKGKLIEQESKNIIGIVSNSPVGDTNFKSYNVNYTKSWVNSIGNRRVFVSILNTTIYFAYNMNQYVSHVFYRIDQQKRTCSFWQCKWVGDDRNGSVNPNFIINSSSQWTIRASMNNYASFSSERYSKEMAIMIGTTVNPPFQTAVFNVLNSSSLQYYEELMQLNHNFTGLNYSFDPQP